MSVKYRSTRGGKIDATFEEVVLGGLALDKGLYIPESIPEVSLEEIEKLRGLSFPEVAFAIISKFVRDDEVPAESLKEIIQNSFKSFRSPEVTPSVKLSEFWVLELFHGPTFAFKDVALQFLGNLFEFFLQRGKIQSTLTILGATSGDTGSAAIHGLRGKANINCFIMFPHGKVTEIQERQMTTIPDENVHCISVHGDFDDCQAIVKESFQNNKFREDTKLGAINSINWARVLAQITYYFYSWLKITEDVAPQDRIPINYVVPTGNFGDILAGYYAKQMGLPIGKLVVSTNENDVLHRFFETGVYKKNPAIFTIAPSMDISISSNFERYLYYLAGTNCETLKTWMVEFETTGVLTVPSEILAVAKKTFTSSASNKERIISAMQSIYSQDHYLVCPHTATAVVAVRDCHLSSDSTVVLATAHPAKFEEAVEIALGGKDRIPPRPEIVQALFSLPTRVSIVENNAETVQNFIAQKLQPASTATNSSVNSSGKCPVDNAAMVANILVTVGATVLTTWLILRYLKRT